MSNEAGACYGFTIISYDDTTFADRLANVYIYVEVEALFLCLDINISHFNYNNHNNSLRSQTPQTHPTTCLTTNPLVRLSFELPDSISICLTRLQSTTVSVRTASPTSVSTPAVRCLETLSIVHQI